MFGGYGIRDRTSLVMLMVFSGTSHHVIVAATAWPGSYAGSMVQPYDTDAGAGLFSRRERARAKSARRPGESKARDTIAWCFAIPYSDGNWARGKSGVAGKSG